ncbi:hypothetical protein PUR57_05350 [Streptomyces sp. JV176]|uniref:hypothetical protein n=1 Tax=Streptomyces sp. JV176 TaxID=858630 RepID=UPI002E767340|nr:hypothetical protein [Streptomyces sp. JV176]MEE1798108.1 hypothetical protein [Streptomyces sp. JV176]
MLGFGEAAEHDVVGRALHYGDEGDAGLRTLGEFARADLSGRTALETVPFVVSALGNVERWWLLWLAEARAVTAPTVPGKALAGPVEEMEAVTRAFAEVASRLGGAGIRESVVQYLSDHVVPLVLRGDLPAGQRRRLVAVGAELSATAGWCSYDAGLDGVAQRYLVQALRWCAEGGERVLGGQVLAGLARLVLGRGYGARGVDLARVGVATSQEAACGVGLMRLYAMSARGYAELGRVREVRETLERAEAAFARGCGAGECRWGRFLGGSCLDSETAVCWLVLGEAERAEKFAASVAGCESSGLRRALGQAMLAVAQLDQGRLEDALVSADAALWQVAGLRSERAVRALRDFRARLEPYGGEWAVRAFLLRAGPLLDGSG